MTPRVELMAKILREAPMKYSFSEGQLNAPCDATAVDNLSTGLSVKLPKTYIEFLEKYNGGEGFIEDNYIFFWKAEELTEFNLEYEVETYAQGIFLFASNGGGEGYGFDTNDPDMPIIRIPFIGMSRQYIVLVARDLPDMFARLAS